MNIFEQDATYIANTYARAQLAIAHGKGSLVYDDAGREYIDLGAGIAVNSFGVGDEEWKDAVIAQLGKVQHASNLYYTHPQAELAELLCARTGMKKVFFGNSGAEANECAIKTARKYSSDQYGDGRSTIVTLKNSFHGRTITTLAASGQDSLHQHFGPFTPGFAYVTAGDIAELEAAMNQKDVCALMIELIQGEGGLNVLEEGYVKAAAKLAAERDILLIIDEVQTGNGRTGKLYCYMNYGIEPDLVSTAKGIGGGLPIGVTLFSEKTAGVLTAGTHGSTFGGNPICAAGALSIMRRIDDKLMAEVAKKGEYIKAALSGQKGVKSVCGLGLMIGVEPEKDAKDVAKACLEKGLIVLTAKTKIRLLPALNIPMAQLEKAIDLFKEVLAS